MRKYQIRLWLYIIPVILLTGFTKHNEIENNSPVHKPNGTTTFIDPAAEPVKISIADARVVKSDRGQRPVEVMVFLSQAASDPVTVKYATKNGNATAGVDYVAASGTITFAPGETLKRIRVIIIGEVAAEPDEDAHIVAEESLQINLTEARNAILGNITAIITIIKDILRDPRISGGNRSVYEVRFSFTGYTLFYGTLEDCPIRPSGKVVLTGLLSGVERTEDLTDDVVYTGTLQLDIDIDICSAMRLANGQDKLCGITITGAGPVETALEIYYDGRGGYIQIKDTTSGGFRKNAGGTCDPAEINEERTMIPLKTIATIFNGLELPMLTHRTLREGPSQILRTEFGELLVEVLRKVR